MSIDSDLLLDKTSNVDDVDGSVAVGLLDFNNCQRLR
jgi:hypothetical protein